AYPGGGGCDCGAYAVAVTGGSSCVGTCTVGGDGAGGCVVTVAVTLWALAAAGSTIAAKTQASGSVFMHHLYHRRRGKDADARTSRASGVRARRATAPRTARGRCVVSARVRSLSVRRSGTTRRGADRRRAALPCTLRRRRSSRAPSVWWSRTCGHHAPS